MAYKGKYKLKNTHKYIGDPMNVIYRSLWERKFMVYADNSDNILKVLDTYSKNLNEIKEAIKNKDSKKLLEIFSSTKKVTSRLS